MTRSNKTLGNLLKNHYCAVECKDTTYMYICRNITVFAIFALQFDLNEDVGYEAGSEEGSVEDVLPPRKHIQPLLYILMAQPHAFLSRLSSMHKVQVC